MKMAKSRWGTKLALGIVIAGSLVGGAATGASASSAAAGENLDLSIATNAHVNPARTLYFHSTLTLGYNHIHVWGSGNNFNTRQFRGSLGGTSGSVRLRHPLYRGHKICAQLWQSNGGRHYTSYGLACIRQ